jgi:hypothetical protein
MEGQLTTKSGGGVGKSGRCRVGRRRYSMGRWLAIIAAAVFPGMPGLTGCTAPAGENQNPTVDAGADQNVTAGVLVTLSGSGFDPDGDAVGFTWTQTAGTAVILSGASTANPRFVAPATAGVLTFELTVSDGRGGIAVDSVNVAVTTSTPTVASRLFIANFLGNSITSYADPGTVSGDVPPDAILTGTDTQLVNPTDVVVGLLGELFVSNLSAPSVTTYANVETDSGNVAPTGDVQGRDTLLAGGPLGLAIDRVNDLLFVSKVGASPAILVFSDVSAPSFTGSRPPTHVITTTGTMTGPFGINLDRSGNLYVANNATEMILVYAGAASLNGNVVPTRKITGNPAFRGVYGVFVDDADRMYVVNSAAPRIDIFNNASTLNGMAVPDSSLVIPGAGTLTSIAVDKGGRGYITEEIPGPGRVYSYDQIATLNGPVPPTRVIAGPHTQLDAPIGVFVRE